jgi:hypothetical protein
LLAAKRKVEAKAIAETKRLQKENERLQIEVERLEMELVSNAALLLGKKKLAKERAKGKNGKSPKTEMQLQEEREVDLIMQAIMENGNWMKKMNKKGKEKERAEGRGKGKERAEDVAEEMGPEEGHDDDATRSEEASGRRNAKGKRSASTSADLDALGSDKVVFGAKTLVDQETNPWDDAVLDEGEEDVPRLDPGLSFINDNNFDSDTPLSEEEMGPPASQASLNGTSSEPAPPDRRRPRRYLRVRDFNPYSLKLAEAEAQVEAETPTYTNGVHVDSMAGFNLSKGKGKGKQRALLSPSPPPSSLSYSCSYPAHLGINYDPSLPSSTNPSAHGDPINRRTVNSLGNLKGQGKASKSWSRRRVVREPSTTPVKGVFKQDIVSSLPYTEVVSEETFEVTDVMMDDCRLLLLKVRFRLHFLALTISVLLACGPFTTPCGPGFLTTWADN